ncbi:MULTISPECIES: YggS family pyridoxal phosphate-dependent enzyme [Francisella]|uniref:Pyridoxal phosphate homeostasis protein n=1 Tax=Francisella opportunistica TaxID=2016517 RepID=A0A345JPA0_9GAMM|nr:MULTISPECIES: YggS family pyridoxal phosphate-dependent enzyme [Francisella]APC90806.1 YggS, proline synthase [Francisella sp. MA067296]AXH29146.1 YggS family pyridoxal phosphate-dependent enzyme [Francisella opportunistica]AXH30797.1 YggS family pyridoxal phosphate enzyme [Francisella opportunistica]AXH32442.1 YggS family pyridoxal phosphate enzyme [Francisella opportunistica]
MIDKEFIQNSYTNIIQNIDSKAGLLAVSKYQSIEKIKYLASLGQLDFGENYFQELEQKAQQLPDLRWHFIGSLQSRKIKHIVKYVDSIQSVEKQEQLEKIDNAARQLAKTVDVFLQVNIDDDINKSGFKSTQLEEVVETVVKAKSFRNLKVVGLMCIPAKSNFPDKSFAKMKSFFDTVNSSLTHELKLSRLSMGMSADYKLAIQYGSTDVRVGSSLFGARSA